MLARRVDNLRNYLYLAARFRNSAELIRAYRQGPPCESAVLWDGTQLIHPQDRGGLVGTILELWKDRCYTPPGFYEPQDGDWIVDAGAHVGLFSLSMSYRNKGCQVLAFEPFAENYDCLLKNLDAAHARNVTPFPFALGGTSGEAFMQPVGARSIDHLLQPHDAENACRVPVISLAGILEHVGDHQVAMLKMDVEGAEFDAFSTATPHTIARFDRIAMEYHDNLRPGTLSLMRQKLGPTHDLQIEPTQDRGYGILLAKRRALTKCP